MIWQHPPQGRVWAAALLAGWLLCACNPALDWRELSWPAGGFSVLLPGRPDEAQRDLMVARIKAEFPDGVTCTEPEGGMFLWVTLPAGCSAFALFDLCIKEKVAFVPGEPFFVDGSGQNSMRLNFSNAEPERIIEGISRMGRAIAKLLEKSACSVGE